MLISALPPQGGDFQTSPTPFIIAFGIGMLLGTMGHVYKSKTMVAIGVGMIMLSTVVVPLYLAFTR